MRYLMILLCILLGPCTCTPADIKAIENFELQRYLGQWYEIARLDHSFERGLSHVSAHYTLNSDGSITVTNRGFKADKNLWDEAQGRALMAEDPTVGYLKISFFGPFFGSYVIFELDQLHYQYAFVQLQ